MNKLIKLFFQHFKYKTHHKGQAALIATILVFAVGTVIISSVVSITISRLRSVTDLKSSVQSYYTAESGLEDSLLRIVNSDYSYQPNVTITGGSGSADIIVGQAGNNITITSTGNYDNLVRKMRVTLATDAAGASFNYGIQVGAGGLTMKDNTIVYGNVYSNGSVIGQNHATVMGDVFVATGLPSLTDSEYTFSNADHLLANTGSNKAAAQSFRPMATGAVTQVSVYIAKVETPNDNLNVRVVSDNGNKPSGTTLTMASIPREVVGATASWIDIGFSDTPILTAGTRYWLVVDSGTSHPNRYWKWRKDSTNAYPNETAKYASGCCSGSTNWSNLNADLSFKVWIGGAPTKIEGMTIGDATIGSGRANLFVDSEIHGSPCPNANCIVDSPTPSQMPISDGLIQDWRDQAIAGGDCGPPICNENGDLIVSGHDNIVTIGPKRITGDLIIKDYGELVITGTLLVVGKIDLNNHCSIRLDEGYGSDSGVLMSDYWINVANNCAFAGSGEVGSYPLVLSTHDDSANEAITIDNHSEGVIYYASNGTIVFKNNSSANSAVGYKVSLINNAILTYDEGLLDMRFTAGPSGGFIIESWQEIE